MSMNTLVVGVDALDPHLLDLWQDALPELNTIRREGTASRLESTIPTVTGVAWPSMMTGKLPANHGVTQFTDDGDILDRNSIQSKALWELLDDSDSNICVSGMPGSYPPDPINGVIVSGMFTPEGTDDWIHPPDLGGEIPKPVIDTGKADEEALLNAVESRRECSLELLKRRDWDVFVTTFLESDRGGHSLLRPKTDGNVEGYDDLKTIYIAIDEALGDIVEAANPRNVIVVSDHGFGRVPRKRINVYQWLVDQGFVEMSANATPTGLLTKERVERLLDATPILSLMPKRLKQFGRESLPSRRIETESDRSGDDITYTEYWLHGGFDVPDDGPVEELVSGLEGLSDPETGERLFESVIRSGTIYDGPYADQLPTVLVRFAPNYRGQPTVGDGLVEPIPTNAVEPDHRLHGVLLTAGSDFAKDSDGWLNGPHVCDVTPTLLHLLGHPVPSDCDGSVRRELFDRNSAAKMDPITSGPPSADNRNGDEREKADVRERLEELGYIQ